MPKLRTGTAPSYSACDWSQQVARLQSGAEKETLTSGEEEVRSGIAKGRAGCGLAWRVTAVCTVCCVVSGHRGKAAYPLCISPVNPP